ncbi:hypothetical protein F4803DRAFT_578036 [Xylaria telfairii]|nr:hypothetical protein F4803DRAFT_578036 [Xylaria telfairii]
MASTHPEEPMASSNELGDIRQKYPGDNLRQNYALQHLHPVTFSAKKARDSVTGWADKEFKDEEIQALDIVIMLLRHLFSFVAPEHRQEDTNPFAKMIWADVGRDMTRSAQTQERARILLKFSSDSETTTLAIDAHNLLENEPMWRTIWNMPAFLLFEPRIMACPVEGGQWVEAEPIPGTFLSRNSQVHYSGSGDLGECISDNFGTRLVEEDGFKYHWQAAYHVAMRVLYDTTAPDSQAKGFDELREIFVNTYRYKPTGEEGRARYDPDHRDRYTLAAVVRMMNRHEPRSRDLVRLYNDIGYYQPLPLTMQKAFTTEGKMASEEWRLGELGYKYMLFYITAPEDPVPIQVTPTESYDFSEYAATYRMARLILQPREAAADEAGGSGGFLRPPPTAPKSMREAEDIKEDKEAEDKEAEDKEAEDKEAAQGQQ